MPVAKFPASDTAAPTASSGAIAAPLVVVSPHYDDAVFSCGRLLALMPGSTVLTVYAGVPQPGDLLTDWDRRCGFEHADQAMEVRRGENAVALAHLHAQAVDLDHLDSQYVAASAAAMQHIGAVAKPTLAETLIASLARLQPSSVFIPMGLFHQDHIKVSDTLLVARRRLPHVAWHAYADVPYSRRPELVEARHKQLSERGLNMKSMNVYAPPGAKAAAVRAYTSQLRGLCHRDEARIMQQTEQYWRINDHGG